jgi:hypothetical protein
MGVGLFVGIVAIVGAYRYNVYMVGFNVLFIMTSFIATIIDELQPETLQQPTGYLDWCWAVGLLASNLAVVGAYRYNVYMDPCIIAMFITTIALVNVDYYGDMDIPFFIRRFGLQEVSMLLLIYPHVGFMYQVKAATIHNGISRLEALQLRIKQEYIMHRRRVLICAAAIMVILSAIILRRYKC